MKITAIAAADDNRCNVGVVCLIPFGIIRKAMSAWADLVGPSDPLGTYRQSDRGRVGGRFVGPDRSWDVLRGWRMAPWMAEAKAT